MPARPYAESCEQNREPILAVLRDWLGSRRRLLEIGSGTGQHAVYFAAEFPDLVWQSSDCAAGLPGIRAWLDSAGLPNLPLPLALDVLHDAWPERGFDAAFSANTAHIMHEDAVTAMFEGLGRCLEAGAPFVLYGPFNSDGCYTSTSNARFDERLRERDPRSGIKDAGWLCGLAERNGMQLADTVGMPANNRIMVWLKN